MFRHLQIYDPRDRVLVGTADLGLRVAAPAVKLLRAAAVDPPRRILILRLERIGDLLMSLDAIADIRRAAPAAEIDLVVGSWNADLARRIGDVTRVSTLDAAWLSREGTGATLPAMLRAACGWRGRRYDLGMNFEPDIRSNLILAASGAARTAGFASGGGGALLDTALPYDPRQHTSINARRLAAAVLDVPPAPIPARLHLTGDDRKRAEERLAGFRRPLVGVHVSGGRAIKQWPPDRFADVAARLARTSGATIVLTGTAADRALIEPVVTALAGLPVANLAGDVDLPILAAVLEQLDLLITGDTGPMHLAAAVSTPVVAIFGPSDPARYAPPDPPHRVVRIDLPCSPCNRIRLPPERCTGHTPDCLAGISAEMVYRVAESVLNDRAGVRAPGSASER